MAILKLRTFRSFDVLTATKLHTTAKSDGQGRRRRWLWSEMTSRGKMS